jgi:hypothetical protein
MNKTTDRRALNKLWDIAGAARGQRTPAVASSDSRTYHKSNHNMFDMYTFYIHGKRRDLFNSLIHELVAIFQEVRGERRKK